VNALEWTPVRFRGALWVAARLLPWRVWRQPLNAVLKLAEPGDTRRYVGLSPAFIARAIRRATRHPWLMRDRRCLRDGILGYRFLSEAGLHPELHFAIDPRSMNADRLVAHCWVCLDGEPVINDRRADMTVILVHSANASRRQKA
jgi:hypothetical protein